MKLFYSTGACSLAAHIAAIETRMPHQLVKVTHDKRTSDGRDFMTISPNGFVPALEFDDGTVLTETIAVLIYIAAQSGTLLPENSPNYWKAIEATSFLTTEVHSNFKPLWRNGTAEEKDKAFRLLAKHFSFLATQLGEKTFLASQQMTIADPYLFVMLMWARVHRIVVPASLDSYFSRMHKESSVARAIAEEQEHMPAH